MSKVSCIVLAAGAGRRMGHDENKIFIKLGQKSIIQWTLSHINQVKAVSEVILVVADGEASYMEQHIASLGLSKSIKIVTGGKERQDSVYAGLQAVGDDIDIVLVHDGARPLAKSELFERVIEGAETHGAVTIGVPSTDTIKRVDIDGQVLETLNRNELMNIQTPQGFLKDIFKEAQETAKQDAYLGTDDVSLVEYIGKDVYILDGDYENIKVTTPNDIAVAKRYLGIKEQRMRVGFGYDIHRLKEGRPCILGGVHIESPVGPDGHSDYFPPEDDAYKGISSMILLKHVNSLLKERGLEAYNIDIMVISETPKLKPHIDTMKANLQSVLEIPLDRISIKATTNEMLGAIGRREGIAAQAVVSVYEGEV
ncbi:MAG: 2-C-methyl-D-erythritol 4-phosphate cytidylyltransferase [Veillonella sp.]|nr:2-C-methyl-D-erythritol 4-phosphate cytidylyltransferase [Veillonella sp.]